MYNNLLTYIIIIKLILLLLIVVVFKDNIIIKANWVSFSNLFRYTSIGKTGVISEIATLFRLKGEPEGHGFSSRFDRKRLTTVSRSRDIWKALYASAWTPSRLDMQMYVFFNYRIVFKSDRKKTLNTRALTYVSVRR